MRVSFTAPLLLLLLGCAPRGAPPSAAVADRHQEIAALWEVDDPSVAEQRFARAAAAARDPIHRGHLLTQQARALGLLGREAEARTLLAAIEPADNGLQARILLERARLPTTGGEVDAPLSWLDEAWTLARAASEDLLAVDAAHLASRLTPQPSDAISFLDRALSMAEQSSDPAAQAWVGPLAEKLGWAHHQVGAFPEALVAWRRGLTWHEGRRDESAARRARWSVARGLRSSGEFDEALAMQLELLVAAKEYREPTGLIHEELAELYLAKGLETQATRHFVKAYAALQYDVRLRTEDPARLTRLKELAGQ